MLNKFFKTIHNKYFRLLKFIFFLRYLFAIFFVSIFLFLIVPIFLNHEKKAEIIKNYLEENYDFEINEYENIKFMPTFHPAYLLRSPSKKREAWQDLQKVMAYLK